MILWCLWKECVALRTPLFTANIKFCVRHSVTTCLPPLFFYWRHLTSTEFPMVILFLGFLPSLNESFGEVTFKFNFLYTIKATPGWEFPELLFFFKSIFNENTVGLWNHLIHLSAVGSFRENNVRPHPTRQRRGGLKIGRGRNGLPLLGMKCINSIMVHS